MLLHKFHFSSYCKHSHRQEVSMDNMNYKLKGNFYAHVENVGMK